MGDKYEALRESLGAMSQFGKWSRSRSHVGIAESDEWCSVDISVHANKLASRKVSNYISVARPDVTRTLLAERDGLLAAARLALEEAEGLIHDEYDGTKSFDGLMGEVDELRRTYGGDGDMRAEAFDVAVCAYRIATEGDTGGNALLPGQPAATIIPGEIHDIMHSGTTVVLFFGSVEAARSAYNAIEGAHRVAVNIGQPAASAEPVARDWKAIEEAIQEYLDGYELRDGDGGDHFPTEFERFLIDDAIHGLLDDEFLALLAAPVTAHPVVTEEMVSRFLGWRLPEDFAPDGGIRFTPPPIPPCTWPSGTNLFRAGQARAMLEYVLGDPVAAQAQQTTVYPGDDIADRLDSMADGQPAGSQSQSDLYAAATAWRKHVGARPPVQAQPVVNQSTELEAFEAWLLTHDPRVFTPEAYLDQRYKWKAWQARAALAQQPSTQDQKCRTCGGTGWIGGPSYYAPDEGGEPCPDCAREQDREDAEIGAAEATLLAKTLDEFGDCGETTTDHRTLLRWTFLGLLECTHFVETDKGRAIAARAAKGAAHG